MLKSCLSRKAWPAWTILGAVLAITAFASFQVRRDIEKDAVSRFAFTCDQIILKIEQRLVVHKLILRGGASFFVGSESADRRQWRSYVETLRADIHIPGVQGIGYSEIVPPDRLEAHIARIRREGFPAYTVWPSGKRDLYTAIVYLEPFEGRNLRAFGYDMYSEPVRRAAMEQARDNDLAALSGKIELVQETGKAVQAGTLMYVPVYRKGMPTDTVEQRRAAIAGWVYSPYRMNDLMEGILGAWETQGGNAVDLHIYDGPSVAPGALLFDSIPANAPDPHSRFLQRRMLDFNGRPWLLVFDLVAGEKANIDYSMAWQTLFGGLVTGTLLFGLMLSRIDMLANARRIAGELTDAIGERELILRRSEERFRTVADYTYDWEYWLGPNREILYVSPSCERITGYSPAEFEADPGLLDRIVLPDDREIMEAHLHDERAHDESAVDYRIVRRDGEIRWIAHGCRSAYGPGGQYLGRRASNRDDTERKLAEQELQRSNAELEQFSYAISHDMRQPLRMISSYMKLLEKKLAGQLDGENREFFDFAINGAKRLDQMLVALLDYSRVGRKGEPPAWVESRALLDEALLFLQPAIAEAQAEVKISGDWPRVYVSRDEMTRLLQNLIGNAVKYRVAGRKPEISVNSEMVGNEWCLSVADNGVGILPDQIHRLFQVFQRLHTQSAYEGTGIGLALCRKIAEHHGGRIEAESAGEGRGSTFRVRLPLRRDESAGDGREIEAAP